MIFPTGRKLTAQSRIQQRSVFRISRRVTLNQAAPFGLLLFAPFDGSAEVGQRFIWNIETLVFRPTEMSLRFSHRFFTGCVAVCFARTLSRHAKTDDSLN